MHRALLFDLVVNLDLSARAAARYHGDQAAEPGMLDFAVNVRHAQPPAWLVQRLAAWLPGLACLQWTAIAVCCAPVAEAGRSDAVR